MHIVGQRHEFVFAQLVVTVFVKLLEQLFRLGQIRRRTIRSTGATSWSAPTFGTSITIGTGTTSTIGATLAIRPPATFAAFASLAAAAAIAVHFPHVFAGLLAFFVAQLAVFIGIEFLEHPLAHFFALRILARVLVFFRPGQRRQR